MKIYGLSIFAGLMVLLSFQNCQKAPHQDEISNSVATSVTGASTTNKINLSEQQVSSVDLLIQEVQTLVKNERTFSVVVNKTLQIDLSSGRISATSDLAQDVQFYCLTADLKNELLSIIKSSSVCKSTNTKSNLQVCAQVLRLPYARISTSNEVFSLGSASDSCGTDSIDLCNDESALLKGFSANLKTKLSTLVCI
ncbi:MAG: hypothetical protein WA160_01170 [Pseudobdellovibrio sp.]